MLLLSNNCSDKCFLFTSFVLLITSLDYFSSCSFHIFVFSGGDSRSDSKHGHENGHAIDQKNRRAGDGA